MKELHESVSRLDDNLERVKLYIDKLARNFASSEFTEADIEDLAQTSWIKFWRVSQKQEVMYLKTYLRHIVHSEFISMMRRRKNQLLFPLKTMEECEYEYPQDAVLIEHSEWMRDPQEALEQREAAEERMLAIADAVLALPTQQQCAMRCWLSERVDDLIGFVDAFKRHNVDVEMHWPSNRVEKQRLQASCRPARQKIAQRLNIDIQLYDKVRNPHYTPYASQACSCCTCL